MRSAFVNQLVEEAKRNPNIFLLVGDLGYHVVEPFAEQFPDRFINVGIAEQNMAGIAAGLASTGCKVYIYSIGNFPTLRCLEQIRNNISYHGLDVKVVAVGAGYAYGAAGMTHQATEDIGVMRSLPNMVVATPCDPYEAGALTHLSALYGGPMYLRLGKAGERCMHRHEIADLHIGSLLPIRVHRDNHVAVLACGSIVADVVNKIDEGKLPYNLYSVPFVKPLCQEQLVEIVGAHRGGLMTIEEHQASCGCGSAIAESLCDLYAVGKIAAFPKLRRIAIRDVYADVVGDQDYLRERMGLIIS